MKRLYVTPAARGLGLGVELIRSIVGQARTAGYAEMRLDTLPTMHAAIAMYARADFAEIGAYYPTPVEGTIFLALRL
jgi:ribosomal protein S18 acetylase RimI-like enzyme